MQSQSEIEVRTFSLPLTLKFVKFFKFELDIHDYHPRSTPVQIFISIRSAETSPQIGEIRFCDFFLVTWLVGYTVFFPGRTRGWICFHVSHFQVLWLMRCVFAQGRSFWGCDKIGIHLGNIPKNSPKGA